MKPALYKKVVISGVGLIGGSVALAVKSRGLADQVVGLARSASSVGRLERLGVVDLATDSPEEAYRDAGLVVVAVPVTNVAEHVRQALELAPACVVTDAASTKSLIVRRVIELARDDSGRFVGAHPLAGDHRSGPEHARADLYENALTIVTPHDGVDQAAHQQVSDFWAALGSRVMRLSPEEHDDRLARTSHVPHVVATALALATPEEDLPLAATGWADTTRVAAGGAKLWRDILSQNRRAALEGLETVQGRLEAIANAIKTEDDDGLEKLLEEGKRRRDALGS